MFIVAGYGRTPLFTARRNARIASAELATAFPSVCWPDCKSEEGPLFSAEFVCLSVCLCVCVSLTGTSTLQREPILTKLGHKDPSLI